MSTLEQEDTTSESACSQRLTQPFPYEYAKVCPFLHQHIEIPWWYFVILPLQAVLSPLVFVLKVILLLINFGVALLTYKVLDLFKAPRIRYLNYLKIAACVDLLVQNYWPSREGINRKCESSMVVMNHTNMNDVNIGIFACQAGFLAKIEMQKFYIVRKTMEVLNSVYINRDSGKTDLFARESDNPLIIFPEGTCTNERCLMRFKTGAFRMTDCVQPLICKYNSFLNIEWLTESGFNHIYTMFADLICKCDYRLLDVCEKRHDESYQEFADRVGNIMARELGVAYVPYSADDYLYFMGKRDITKCSTEYLRDYGWMGQQKDYEIMCKMHGLNHIYEHEKYLFKPDIYKAFQQEAQEVIDQRFKRDMQTNMQHLQKPFLLIKKDGKVKINKRIRKECIRYRKDTRRKQLANDPEMAPFLMSSEGEISEAKGSRIPESVNMASQDECA